MEVSSASLAINPYTSLNNQPTSERHLERGNPQLYEELVAKLTEIEKAHKSAEQPAGELANRFEKLEEEMRKVATTREMTLIHAILYARRLGLDNGANG